MASNPPVESKKVWTTLITNTAYLTGLLTLDYSLKKHGTAYPLVALYTDTFPPEGHKALDERGIPKQHVKYLLPKVSKDFTNDPRFYDCWSKLTPFSLVEYDRVVQLDSDMVALQNMDELMEMELDPPSLAGKGDKVFAASHACVCNPLKKPHYPKNWIPENCAFTSQHDTPDDAQIHGASPAFGLGMPNGGLQVVNPSTEVYQLIVDQLSQDTTMDYDFADQSLLGDVFHGRWVALPYIYNALKTLRVQGVHHQIWRDDKVKNVHYILSPKPWDEKPEATSQESHDWWWAVNTERLEAEKKRGIDDGF
ncbi:glycosyltransferase family 8 protein [Aaosphaeria arxii CBS 175.79]|uniref:Glycosyltransferase family 8 protein n=1 Tax=Aaosphaeria arxii CBS 175.79 TaxID=1450172 RepID=A0A6A5XNT3_9PLEO|nr:glycosyltransferase family 8 protein [Aaosphaeria arxii CBS 175.79]KAF2014915.1 glycosyltransferase family 8 protein [Aaosphaeria arxii CBS 175.79]